MTSTITVHDVLDHPRRAAILDLLRREPGASFGRLIRVAGGAIGVTSYHVHVLERAGLITRRWSGKHVRRHYLAVEPGPNPDQDAAARSCVLSERILAIARRSPGTDFTDFWRATDRQVSRQAVAHHLRRLEHVRLLRVERDGRHKRVYPTTPKETA